MKTMHPFKQDRSRYYQINFRTASPGILKKIKLFLTNNGFQCVMVYRFGHSSLILYKKNRILGIIPIVVYFFLNYLTQTLHHVIIDKNASIGPGLYLMHYYSLIIGPCKIGEKFTVHQNVTIGQGVANLDHSLPEIGDNVWVGPNCVITGGIKIGNNVTISAGTILSKDIPDNCLVAGNPGRVLMNDYDRKTMSLKKKEETS